MAARLALKASGISFSTVLSKRLIHTLYRPRELERMARDIFHDAVIRALEKQKWTITADPLRIEFGDIKFQ
ncbi:MAG: element excision factor XisH family protein [Cyanobacteria bacterium J06623_5]